MADSEGFTEILFAIEELGALMKTKVMALGQYRAELRDLAALSPLSWEGSSDSSGCSPLSRTCGMKQCIKAPPLDMPPIVALTFA